MILAKTPQFAAFVNYPDDYKFFTLPTIGPADELLTRIAAQLTNAYGNASLQGDDAGSMPSCRRPPTRPTAS